MFELKHYWSKIISIKSRRGRMINTRRNVRLKNYVVGAGIGFVFIVLRVVSSYQERSIQIGLWSTCVFVPLLVPRLSKLKCGWVWYATAICITLHCFLIFALRDYFPFGSVLPIAGITIVEAFIFILIFVRFDPEID
jgi:hypothetical protein